MAKFQRNVIKNAASSLQNSQARQRLSQSLNTLAETHCSIFPMLGLLVGRRRFIVQIERLIAQVQLTRQSQATIVLGFGR